MWNALDSRKPSSPQLQLAFAPRCCDDMIQCDKAAPKADRDFQTQSCRLSLMTPFVKRMERTRHMAERRGMAESYMEQRRFRVRGDLNLVTGIPGS